MKSNFWELTANALDWLMPAQCSACQARKTPKGLALCNNCLNEVKHRASYCQQCGCDFIANFDHCGRCLSKPPHHDECVSPFIFSGTMQELIWRFKYAGQYPLARVLAGMFAAEIDIENRPEAIVATPIHRSKLRERGYNQSYLLAKHLARLLDIPLLTNAIVKPKATQAQAKLSMKARQTNLRGSFAVTQKITQKHIAIVDDVITTGATMNEISKTLKKNGVDYVQAWGLAYRPELID